MFKLIKEFHKLDFGKLMRVYRESNGYNADAFYPSEEASVRVLYAEQDFLSYLREVFFQTDGAFYAVWEENGDYLSALRMEPYQGGFLLEGLETHPDHRRKGYAKSLLQDVLAYLVQNNETDVFSHVDKRNTASLRTHVVCGFERILEHAVYIDGSVSQDSCTMCFQKPRA